MKRNVLLSDCKRFLIFTPRFPDIPRKISEYLQSDFPSGANARNIRGFYNIFNVNDLSSMEISSHCKNHHVAPRNGLYRTAKRAISECGTNNFGLCYGVYQNVVLYQMSFIMSVLIFVYTSFTIIFCKIKSRKIVSTSRVCSLETPGTGVSENA